MNLIICINILCEGALAKRNLIDLFVSYELHNHVPFSYSLPTRKPIHNFKVILEEF